MARVKTGGQVILFSDGPANVHVVERANKGSFVTVCGAFRRLTPLSRIGNPGTTRCPTCLWCVARKAK